MRSSFAAALFLGVSLVSSAPVSPNPAQVLQERNLCNADNLLRLLRNPDNIQAAITFCSSYLNLPPRTITVVTVTPTQTQDQTITVTEVEQVTRTVTDVNSYTDTVTGVSTSVTATTTTEVATATETIYTTVIKQRRRRTNSTPLPDRILTYPPDRISSACSCITIPVSISSVTYTAPPVTVTVTKSQTTETTETITKTTTTSTTTTETTLTTTTTTQQTKVDTTTTTTTYITSTTTPPPPPQTCDIGTAFGYVRPPGSPVAINFNGDFVGPAIDDNTCKRWGWYFKMTAEDLSKGFDGVLLVGAGGNDVTKAIEVGTFEVTFASGKLTVSYHLYDTYDLSEVHIYAACSEPDKCSPGSYTYPGGGPQPNLLGTADREFTIEISLNEGCSSYWLIFHAKVNQASASCPPPVD